MYKISNLEDNSNVKVIDQMGCVKVVEYQSDLSVQPDDAAAVYFAQKMNIKRRQVMIELNDNSFILQSGAMQWVAGNITSGSGIKGIGDLVGKMLTQIEAMNLRESVEKANKDIVRQILWSWWGSVQENSMTSSGLCIGPIVAPNDTGVVSDLPYVWHTKDGKIKNFGNDGSE